MDVVGAMVTWHMGVFLPWNRLFFPILLTAQIWHTLTTTSLALYKMHYVDDILQTTVS
jgi:hypothetical protein